MSYQSYTQLANKAPADDDKDGSCEADLRGACDCTKCRRRIIRNAKLLLALGWIVHYYKNGPGGCCLCVKTPAELVAVLCDADRAHPDWLATDTLDPAEIERITTEVAPGAWTEHSDHESMIRDWRRWFHLLPPPPHASLNHAKRLLNDINAPDTPDAPDAPVAKRARPASSQWREWHEWVVNNIAIGTHKASPQQLEKVLALLGVLGIGHVSQLRAISEADLLAPAPADDFVLRGMLAKLHHAAQRLPPQ